MNSQQPEMASYSSTNRLMIYLPPQSATGRLPSTLLRSIPSGAVLLASQWQDFKLALEANSDLYREFEPSFTAVARAWVNAPKEQRDKHFFATLDFDDGHAVFQKVIAPSYSTKPHSRTDALISLACLLRQVFTCIPRPKDQMRLQKRPPSNTISNSRTFSKHL